MALDVPAPVGDVCDLAAKTVERDRELHAVALDRAADLGGTALCHQLLPSSGGAGSADGAGGGTGGASGGAGAADGAGGGTGGACGGAGGAGGVEAPLAGPSAGGAPSPELTVSRILCASSIAMVGTGGAPFL